jgi:oxygen-independent coproporphyrinogen-3 oxidase
MDFGIYVHIPYCLQHCPYCDFATYEVGKGPDRKEYLDLIFKEIQVNAKFFRPLEASSIYFGGGTPSLMTPDELDQILACLKSHGIGFKRDVEITLEINPGTLTRSIISEWTSIGFNRFSVGAQTFNDRLLKKIGRRHQASDTRHALALLNEFKLNYSFDLLFALPEQSLDVLRADLEAINALKPPHISLYCLTVEESNPLAKYQPLDEIQAEMFELIWTSLSKNFEHYEISNFATPGFRSSHNQLYWKRDPYWGIGLSSHSYLSPMAQKVIFPEKAPASSGGIRFWNPRSYPNFKQLVSSKFEERQRSSQKAKGSLEHLLFKGHFEFLNELQGVSEACYLRLRHLGHPHGLLVGELEFSEQAKKLALVALSELSKKGWVIREPETGAYRLTREGILMSDSVFLELTFTT